MIESTIPENDAIGGSPDDGRGVIDVPLRDIDSALKAIRCHLKMHKAVMEPESTVSALSTKMQLLDYFLAKISADCEQLFGAGCGKPAALQRLLPKRKNGPSTHR